MEKNIVVMVFVLFVFGTIGCNNKVKKAPATTIEETKKQTFLEQSFIEVAQTDEDYNESSDNEYTSDTVESTDDIGTIESEDEYELNPEDAEESDDSNDDEGSDEYESETDNTENSNW